MSRSYIRGFDVKVSAEEELPGEPILTGDIPRTLEIFATATYINSDVWECFAQHQEGNAVVSFSTSARPPLVRRLRRLGHNYHQLRHVYSPWRAFRVALQTLKTGDIVFSLADYKLRVNIEGEKGDE